jgi:hypothetical protein
MTRSKRKSEVLPSVARSAGTLFTPARRSERRRFRRLLGEAIDDPALRTELATG